MPPSPAAPAKPAPAADRVYAHVKQGVLERRYEGGTMLTEGELADAVGVSRTPVREALLRLQAEGLLELYPKKGAFVLPVSAQEIADVVETRMLVEEHAARRSVPAPDALLTRLEELLEEQRRHVEADDRAAASVTDRCFHATIVRNAGNDILVRLYDQLRDRQLRMGVALMNAQPGRMHRSLTEHAEILQALRSGSADAAAAAVHGHVASVRDLLRGDLR
ncbi:GntR family transcriptional regulator [Streptomyces aculeolatus]|uniref:GntR family transcriptional regulator n=1 Tax=Streptomyces aculeolatus TaxID=270689 RepID=UPI000371DA81|nr:GntR family transcriptional regulator [Streptomyces aculeolatus]